MFTVLLPLILAFAGCLPHSSVAATPISPSSLEMLVIQEGGRKKPYIVFAEETLRSLSGKTTLTIGGTPLGAMDIVTGIWMDPSEAWKQLPLILISNRPLKQQTGLDPIQKLFTYDELSGNQVLLKEISSAAEARRRDPRTKLKGVEKEASDIGLRLGLFESLINGEDFRILAPAEGTDWKSLQMGDQAENIENSPGNSAALDIAEKMHEAWVSENQADFDDAAQKLIKLQTSLGGLPDHWKLSLEVLYQKIHPFRWAWVLYATSGIILLAVRGPWGKTGYRLGWLLAGSGFLLQATGLASRVLIAGRPPVTNMYESVIWVAFGTILFALIFEMIYRAGFFLLGAIPVAVASMILADSQPMILDQSLHPLVPVLRDNFWLTTHVLTITLSYAAFALSLGVAHVALARIIGGLKPSPAIYNYLYKTLQVGVLLLATGTILGGVWANYSWGRFWDWDPKETWALTALLGYLFLLHGRLSGLWGGFGLAVGSVIAFQSVLMAWYGVNFVLGVGLHSYGFGTGGFPLVATFVGCEILFLIAAVIRRRNKPPRQPVEA